MDYESLTNVEIAEATAFRKTSDSYGLVVEEIALILKCYRNVWQKLYGYLMDRQLTASEILDLAYVEGQNLSCAFRIDNLFYLGN